MKIPFYQRSSSFNEAKEVCNVLKSGRLSHGVYTDIFAGELAEYINAPYVVLTNSCTSALYLAIKYYNPEIIGVPSMTFGSVASAVLENNRDFVWTDIMTAGHKYKLVGTNITDSAHEIHRGCFKGGTECFSFYSTKTLSGADGGAIATDDKDFYEWVKLAVNCGRGQFGADYEIEFPSLKYNMSNLQAVICSNYLKRLDKELESRRWIVQMYNQALGENNTSNHLYIIKDKERDDLRSYLESQGIETSIHFRPLHQMKAFKTNIKLPLTESIAPLILSLPLWSNMSLDQIEYVIDKVKDWRSK